MPKIVNEKQYIPFVKGLITEASALTFPEGATVDEANFVINRDGSRQRRLGLEIDPDAQDISHTTSPNESSYHEWPFAGGASITLGVFRVGTKLWFLDMATDSPTLNIKNGGSPITITALDEVPLETTVVNNSLILVSETLATPLLFTYNPVTDSVSYTSLNIKVRDFWGVEDNLALSTRPTTLTTTHKYNLRNQGWISSISTICGSDVFVCTFSTLGKYPSNSDIWVLGKDTNDYYNPNIMARNSQDWMQAAKGKYIIDAFNRGASRQVESGLSGLPQDSEQGSFTTVASFAGRIFYSGISSNILGADSKSPTYSGYIFFTQSITNNDKLNKCYQEADPTSADIPDLIETDGGVISIPSAYRIRKLVSLKSSLVVFAENGIWEIYAGDTGFKATEYQLSKVSNIGITNPKAVVEANDSVVYWSKFGIYVLTPDKVTGRLQAQNISLSSIQTFYNEIPESGKQNAKGLFEEREGRIRWLYSNQIDPENKTKFNRELIFDTTLQAFYPLVLTDNNYWTADYVPIPNYAFSANTDTVYTGTDIVKVGTENVEVTINEKISRNVTFQFMTVNNNIFTLSGYTSKTFLDWGTTNYSSYMITGYELFGDFMRKKQVPIIVFLFKRTETGFDSNLDLENPSSCLVQAQWNWANSANSGKWGTQFQAYRFNRNYIPTGPTDPFDYGEAVITTKNRLRGVGKTLSLKLESEQGKDMHILGWAIRMNGNSLP